MQRCRGLTLLELSTRTGHPPELLRTVLAEELHHRRVELVAGEYRLVADRFDAGTLAALGELEHERVDGNGRAGGPAHASRLGRCSGCGCDFDSRSLGCGACSERFRNRRRRPSMLPNRAA
jgi:hypothetical protein